MGQLDIAVTMEEMGKIARVIVQTMTGRWRNFHTPEHIFEVGGEENPIEVLAALFHDVVYVQVDKSVNFNLSFYIVPFITEIKEQLYVKTSAELPSDRLFSMILEIFGFGPEQALSPFGGQNEFLSAIVGAKALEPFLSETQLVQIIACIEATIPFRPCDDRGRTPAQILCDRLHQVNQRYDLAFSPGEVETTVKTAIRMANRDVGSFANPSPTRFLDGTWSLLPETNHNLHNSSSYTVAEYRLALQKMEGFMGFLQPEIIFQQFADEPSDRQYQQLLQQAETNLAVGRLYLGSKLLTMGILEALSLRLGRDIPLSSMMGELPSQEEDTTAKTNKLIHFIPAIANGHPLKNPVEIEVLGLLEKGRHQNATYDLKNSPLSTYLVKMMGFDEIRRQCDRSKLFFQKKISAEAFLGEIDRTVIEVITEGICQVFEQRKSAIKALMANI